MSSQVTLGTYLSADTLRTSFVEEGQLYQLDAVNLLDQSQRLYWSRPTPAQANYYHPRDLLGANIEQERAQPIIKQAMHRLLEQAASQDLQVKGILLAVPEALSEFQRRHLKALFADDLPPVQLIDVALAGVHSLTASGPPEDKTVAVLVAEDLALEMAVARFTGAHCEILAHHSLPELSRRAVQHHMLQVVLNRLPEQMRQHLCEAEDAELTQLLARMGKSQSLLARVEEINFPVRPEGIEELGVMLRRNDLVSFLDEHTPTLEKAIGEARKRAGLNGSLDQVLIIGDLGSFSDFTQRVGDLLGPVDISPFSRVADGAALAARDLSDFSAGVSEAPPFHSLAQLLENDSPPLQLTSGSLTGTSPEQALEHYFNHIGQLLSQNKVEEARAQLKIVMDRCSRVLSTMPSEQNEPELTFQTTTSSLEQSSSGEEDSTTTAPKTSMRAQRHLEMADRQLKQGNPIEAVHHSHQAYEIAGEDHTVLMAMLDVHRRSADLLAKQKNYEAAEVQLKCALRHRKNDAETRKALADRLVEHALHEEQEGNIPEATRLMEEALEFTEEDGKIMQHLDRLEANL